MLPKSLRNATSEHASKMQPSKSIYIPLASADKSEGGMGVAAHLRDSPRSSHFYVAICVFLMFSFFGDPLTPGPHHPKRHQQPPPKRPQQLPFKRPDADLLHSVFNVVYKDLQEKSHVQFLPLTTLFLCTWLCARDQKKAHTGIARSRCRTNQDFTRPSPQNHLLGGRAEVRDLVRSRVVRCTIPGNPFSYKHYH